MLLPKRREDCQVTRSKWWRGILKTVFLFFFFPKLLYHLYFESDAIEGEYVLPLSDTSEQLLHCKQFSTLGVKRKNMKSMDFGDKADLGLSTSSLFIS